MKDVRALGADCRFGSCLCLLALDYSSVCRVGSPWFAKSSLPYLTTRLTVRNYLFLIALGWLLLNAYQKPPSFSSVLST